MAHMAEKTAGKADTTAGKADTTPDPSTDYAGAFGEGERFTFAGREFVTRLLDLNDVIEIQQRVGGLEELQLDDMATLRFVLWLVLRKGDASLTADEVDAQAYRITEAEVGRLVTMRRLKEAANLTQRVFAASLPEAAPGNA